MQITYASSRPSPRRLENYDTLLTGFAWLSSFVLIGSLILAVMLCLCAIQVPVQPPITVYCFGEASDGCGEPDAEMNNEGEDQGVPAGQPFLGFLDQLLQQLPYIMQR